MEAVKPEVLTFIETWLQEICPETINQKGVHIVAKLCELSVWTFKDKGVAQCHPGRAYLAGVVGWSVTKVSRFTSKLRDWGILRKYQPRVFNTQTQQWEPSTTVYSIAFLGLARVRQLAALLKIDLAHMRKKTSQKGKGKESCVRWAVRRAYVPVSRVAEHVYGRMMSLGKSVEAQEEIRTGDVKRDAELNRFAKLGQRQT